MTKKHLARQETVQQQIAVRGEVYSGPLPHPDVLIKYNQAVPDAAERILQMAESQAKHRQIQEDRVIRANTRNQFLGMIFGFILGFGAIGGGIYLIAIGKDASGLASIITALVSLAGIFIYGRRAQERERRAKQIQPLP